MNTEFIVIVNHLFNQCMLVLYSVFVTPKSNLSNPTSFTVFLLKTKLPLQYRDVKSSKPETSKYRDHSINWLEGDLTNF